MISNFYFAEMKPHVFLVNKVYKIERKHVAE